MDLVDVVSLAVLAYVATRLVAGARASFGARRRDVVTIVRGIRLRHILPVPLVLAVVLTAAVALTTIPGLDWGWWWALGGEGNPVVGVTGTTEGTVWEDVLPLCFLLLLVPAVPLFALREERWFRAGAERRGAWGRLRRDLTFGSAHALAGIPLGAALALSLGGAYFTRCYLREHRRSGSAQRALLESTRAHTAYNLTIVLLVLVVLSVELLNR